MPAPAPLSFPARRAHPRPNPSSPRRRSPSRSYPTRRRTAAAAAADTAAPAATGTAAHTTGGTAAGHATTAPGVVEVRSTGPAAPSTATGDHERDAAGGGDRRAAATAAATANVAAIRSTGAAADRDPQRRPRRDRHSRRHHRGYAPYPRGGPVPPWPPSALIVTKQIPAGTGGVVEFPGVVEEKNGGGPPADAAPGIQVAAPTAPATVAMTRTRRARPDAPTRHLPAKTRSPPTAHRAPHNALSERKRVTAGEHALGEPRGTGARSSSEAAPPHAT